MKFDGFSKFIEYNCPEKLKIFYAIKHRVSHIICLANFCYLSV